MPGEYLQVDGDFLVEARKPKSGWLGKSGEKQTPYIQVGFTVIEDVSQEGKEITWFGYLSDKAMKGTMKRLADAFGFNGDLNALVAGAISFEGHRARITVEGEEYEGKKRWKVKWLNPVDWDGPPRLSDDETKMLVAGLQKKAMAAALEAKAEAGEVKTTAPVQGPPPEDDVPF